MVYSKISIPEAKAMSLSTGGVPERKVERKRSQSKSKKRTTSQASKLHKSETITIRAGPETEKWENLNETKFFCCL